jgi:hypothetical protein
MQPTTRSGGGSASRTVDGEKLLGREVLHPHLDIVRRHADLKQCNSEHRRCQPSVGSVLSSEIDAATDPASELVQTLVSQLGRPVPENPRF